MADFLGPHPEERPSGRILKDATLTSWFEMARVRLLTMRVFV